MERCIRIEKESMQATMEIAAKLNYTFPKFKIKLVGEFKV